MKPDVVIVGAGIAGLSLAWTLHGQGKRVLVVDRSPRAVGASVRNFGMVWPVGHPLGATRQLALRSREIWLGVAGEVGIFAETCGSLTLAYEEVELKVLREFLELAGNDASVGRLIESDEACALSPKVRREGLLGAMHSATEVRVDPREVVHVLACHLKTVGVEIRFGVSVGQVLDGQVVCVDGSVIEAESVVVCAGPELRHLLPGVVSDEGLRKCRLQMMRLRPASRSTPRMGLHLCAGLTLGHYANFRDCPSLPQLIDLHKEKWPAQSRAGIHVLVSQHADGSLTVGDSHEYDEAIGVYHSEEVDEAILAALDEFLDWSEFFVSERWDGYYHSCPGEFYSWVHVSDRVWSLNLFGTGMTLSFGVAEMAAAQVSGTVR